MSKNTNYTNKTKNTATNFDLITEFLLSKKKMKPKVNPNNVNETKSDTFP